MFSRILFGFALVVGLSTAAHATPADDVNALLKTLGDNINKRDAKAIAAMFADDGDLISPAGVAAKNHADAEKVLSGDINGILKGTTSKFTADSVREVGAGAWLVDATHEAANMKGPDGKTMTGKLHVVFVLTKNKANKLQFSAARPYMFLPPPPAAGKK